MTTIKISELKPAGYDLLADSESYMNQLDDNELNSVSGGDRPFNDAGDVVGYIVTAVSAGAAVGGTPFTSTWGCSLAAPAFSYQAVKEAHD